MKTDKVTILCIDDEEEICFALKTLFRLQKWNTITCQNVQDGIRLFKQYRPDLILIDYHMPGVNGVEGVRKIRKLNRLVPIIVFTIDESQSVADEFLEAGASDFALKPIKAPDIVSRIRLHLRLLDSGNEEVYTKGISQSTRTLILDYMETADGPQTANSVAEGTGLAYQTVYRYLQSLVKNNNLEMDNIYGKVGRPKQVYRLKQSREVK